MKHYEETQATVLELKSITCDVCGMEYDNEIELQEFHHIDFVGGYASVFGDMTRIKCDICQHCLKKMIGSHCYFEADDGLVKF